jgi:hypothetical protein
VGENLAYENLVRVEMDRRDDAVFVASDVENMASLINIHTIECRPNVGKVFPRDAANRMIPLLQRRPCFRMNLPKLLGGWLAVAAKAKPVTACIMRLEAVKKWDWLRANL